MQIPEHLLKETLFKKLILMPNRDPSHFWPDQDQVQFSEAVSGTDWQHGRLTYLAKKSDTFPWGWQLATE
jgi:hypothetical protein